MLFFIPIPRVRRRRVVYRSCARRQAENQQPYTVHRPGAVQAAVVSIGACALFACAAGLLGKFGWRYYHAGGILYQVNDNGAAILLCIVGAIIGFFAFWALLAFAGVPKRSVQPPPPPSAARPILPPDDGPLNPRMYYSNRR